RDRRKRNGTYQLAVQMGTNRLHPSRAHSAFRASAGSIRHACGGRSDVGTRIRPLQSAVRAGAGRRPVPRSLAQPPAAQAGPGRGEGSLDMSRSTIGFAGMTHLGLNSAVAAAERGFTVVGFDVASEHIESLKRRDLPMVQPGLPELLAKTQARLTFPDRVADLAACDVVYVSPDVSTDDLGQSDLSGVRALIGMVDAALSPETVLVVLSQVPPGFTRSLSRPSDRRFYQVEALIFGRAIERALHPERFIVGCADPKAALPKPLASFLGAFGCPILPMRYESAELAKVSINMFLVSSISTTNALAELCETIGADWSEIVPALKLDKRIGQYAYLAPGLGIAGGNLERD